MKKINIAFVILISSLTLIFTMNSIMDLLNSKIGTSYGTTALKQCFNDPKIIDYDNILIGTSISRELTLASKDFMFDGNKYYNCGISAISTGLEFHYLLINTLGEKVNLFGKHLLVELSTQTILNNEPLVTVKNFKSYLGILPFKTKLYLIKNYLIHHYQENNFQNLDVLFILIKDLLFPVESIAFISNKPEFEERKNHYLKKVSDKNDLRTDQIEMFKNDFDESSFLAKINDIKILAKNYGATIDFLLVPTNSIYKEKISKLATKSINKAIRDKDNINFIDIRTLDKNEYFADCCHFNAMGQKALLSFMEQYNE